MKIVNFVTVVALASALPAFAQAQTAQQKEQQRIDKRQANQQQRIDSGVKSGQITPQEEKRLRAEQARIQKMEDKARADGKITKAEARKIERAQDRASKDIRRESHDK